MQDEREAIVNTPFPPTAVAIDKENHPLDCPR